MHCSMGLGCVSAACASTGQNCRDFWSLATVYMPRGGPCMLHCLGNGHSLRRVRHKHSGQQITQFGGCARRQTVCQPRWRRRGSSTHCTAGCMWVDAPSFRASPSSCSSPSHRCGHTRFHGHCSCVSARFCLTRSSCLDLGIRPDFNIRLGLSRCCASRFTIGKGAAAPSNSGGHK